MARRRLGELLLQSGEVGVNDLLRALNTAQRLGTRLGEVLLSLDLVDAPQLYRALALQHGVPFVELAEREIPREILGRLPAQVISKRRVLPVGHPRGDPRAPLYVATCAPQQLMELEELRGLLRTPLRFALATPADLGRALRRYGFEHNHEPIELPEETEPFEIVRAYYGG